MPRTRTPEQIRASIELNRRELGDSMEVLRARGDGADRLALAAARPPKEALIGAAVAGFVIGGGIAGSARPRRAAADGAGIPPGSSSPVRVRSTPHRLRPPLAAPHRQRRRPRPRYASN